MTVDQVRAILGQHRQELSALGVLSLSVFGSVARGEARADSDVDLIVELDPALRVDLLDFAHIKSEIEEMLGCAVDLVERHMVRGAWRDEVLAEMVRAA